MATTNSQSSPRQSTERTYGQYCPIAAGLDLIGDRWTLLILRELSMGDQRFTDLRGELTGIAPNLLTERLRSLQAIGLVTTAELPPPAARSVYRLTEEGRRIEPVLRSVARFGISYLTGDPSDVFDASRVAFSLLAPWRRRPETKLRARLIAVNDTTEQAPGETDTVDLVLDLAGMQIEPPTGTPDVTLRVVITDLVRSRQTGEPLVGQLTGDATSRRIFLDQFRLQMAKR
ncbi:MAG TPA: helix-turn-helix domain-containing protein [Ilumatobacteraceae bacterium]|nr:helix-turn-helix domain-containing protein [Ilumatobacteraceae bacterium]